MTIDQMINDIIKREGGYVNHPNDRGGPTKYGITLKTLSGKRRKKCTALDVWLLTEKDAFDIYKEDYYHRPGINFLPIGIPPFVLDSAVHHGPKTAVNILQETLLDLGINPGTIDGMIGPLTVKASKIGMNKLGAHLIVELVHQRIWVFKEIVRANSSQRVFLKGWENRANSFLPGNVA